jgi:hypothetical protein
MTKSKGAPIEIRKSAQSGRLPATPDRVQPARVRRRSPPGRGPARSRQSPYFRSRAAPTTWAPRPGRVPSIYSSPANTPVTRMHTSLRSTSSSTSSVVDVTRNSRVMAFSAVAVRFRPDWFSLFFVPSGSDHSQNPAKPINGLWEIVWK